MNTEIFLTKNQLAELVLQVVGRKSKEHVADRCIARQICSRATVYRALNVDKYDPQNHTHRRVAIEAITFLKEKYSVTFEWVETPALA